MEEIQTDVLINGAGPTGLMMACQLAVHKIPFRIIDQKIKRDNYSGAMILHARTMEILHQLGISLRFLKEGVIVRRINFQFNYGKNLSMDIADFGNGWSLFPYIFILEQSKTENLLRMFVKEHGYAIEDGSSLVGFSQKKGMVTSSVRNGNGKEEVITSRFLIGAGGNNSAVRRQLRIPFYGHTHEELLFVSDSHLDMPDSLSEMLFSFSRNQTLGLFPLPDNRWRMDGAIPALSRKKDEIKFEDVQNFLNSDKNLNLRLLESDWFSVFRSHSRFVPAMKHHHCFLAGDAAHVHSPVGAQGMNTGMHDAYNLAWKLAFFLKGCARPSILDTYQEERLPVAKNVIRYTDKIYRWITDESPVLKFIRLYFFPLLLRLSVMLTKNNPVRKLIFFNVSGVGIHYRKSSLSAYFPSGMFSDKSPLPGDRLPCVQYFIGSSIFDLQEKINYTRYKLLIFGVRTIPSDVQSVVSMYDQVLEAEIIPVNPGTEGVYRMMVRKRQACYLVRPDMYIAWRSDSLDARGLERYLRKYFIPANVTQKS